MKKIITLMAIALTLTACSGNEEAAETKEEIISEEPADQSEAVEETDQNQDEESSVDQNEEEKNEEASSEEDSSHITIKSFDLISGGGEKIGKMSVSIASEDQITDDYIKEWFKKVNKLNNNYDILISTESMQGGKAHGVWRMTGGMVFKNVDFEKDENGVYAVSNSENSEYFSTEE